MRSVRLAARRERCACRRTFTPYEDGGLFRLRTVEVHTLCKVGDAAAGWERDGTLRIEVWPRTDPPRTGNDDEVPVIGMVMRAAHVAGQPLQQHGIGTWFRRITLQNGRAIAG